SYVDQIHSDILLTFSLSRSLALRTCFGFYIHKSHRSAMGFFYFIPISKIPPVTSVISAYCIPIILM
ncbi:MAG: hypothetical protein ACHQM6_10770, partial [Candidatus Kapaibacterium sp.]